MKNEPTAGKADLAKADLAKADLAKADLGIVDLERSRRTSADNRALSAHAAEGGRTGGAVEAWKRFWFQPAPPLGLHWMRVLAGLLFLSWLLPLTAERAALFGLNGFFDAQAHIEQSRLPAGAAPPIGWSLLYLNPDGANATIGEVFWWTSLVVLVLFTLGVATRVTSVLTWVIVVSFLASPASVADTDYVLVILAFYLMLGYLLLGLWSRPLSVVEKLLGPRGTSLLAAFTARREVAPPSYAARFAMRLIQVHFAIIVVSSGLHKLQMGDWWRGAAYWYPLHPALEMTAATLRAEQGTANFTLFFLSLASYLTLAWELVFPFFAFRRRWRPLLLVGAASAFLGSIFLFGEPTFGPAFALFCLSYMSADEWQWVTDLLVRPLVSRTAVAGATPERTARVKANT